MLTSRIQPHGGGADQWANHVLAGRRQPVMRGNELIGGSAVAYGHSCLVFVSFARSQRTRLRVPLQEPGEVASRTGPGAAPCGPESSH